MTDVLQPLRQVSRRYTGTEDRPLRGYLLLDATYLSLVGTIAYNVRRRRLPIPERIGLGDLLLVGVATHKVSRTVAKDAITSPLRAPFNRYKGPGAPAELNEEVVAEGVPHALGELISCPFCLAQWIATGFVTGLVAAPRATRLVASVFAAVSISDFLQMAYAGAGQAVE